MRANPILVPALGTVVVVLLGGCGGRENSSAGTDSGHTASGGGGAQAGTSNTMATSGGSSAAATGGSGPINGTGGVGTAQVGAAGGTGGATTSGGGTGGVPAECKRALSPTECPATYDAALASVQCGGAPRGIRNWWVATCGTLRLFETFYVDVGEDCAYDATGTLVGSRQCSKSVGNCNCFYGGDVDLTTCKDTDATDLCATDAGTQHDQ